jgi:hypothetical protein
MRHQVRPDPDQDGRLGSGLGPMTLAGPLADGATGSAGLWWLWGLVDLRLSLAEPDSAA